MICVARVAPMTGLGGLPKIKDLYSLEASGAIRRHWRHLGWRHWIGWRHWRHWTGAIGLVEPLSHNHQGIACWEMFGADQPAWLPSHGAQWLLEPLDWSHWQWLQSPTWRWAMAPGAIARSQEPLPGLFTGHSVPYCGVVALFHSTTMSHRHPAAP